MLAAIRAQVLAVAAEGADQVPVVVLRALRVRRAPRQEEAHLPVPRLLPPARRDRLDHRLVLRVVVVRTRVITRFEEKERFVQARRSFLFAPSAKEHADVSYDPAIVA